MGNKIDKSPEPEVRKYIMQKSSKERHIKSIIHKNTKEIIHRYTGFSVLHYQ